MYTPKDVSELESKVIDMVNDVRENIQSYNAAEVYEMQCCVVEMMSFMNSLKTALIEKGMELVKPDQWYDSGCSDYDYSWQDSGC